MGLLLYLFICASVTFIIVDSKFFEGIRTILESKSPNFFGYLINCYLCLGFWVGVLLNFIFNPLSEFYYENIWLQIFFYPIFTIFAASLSSLSSYFVGKILTVLSNLEELLEKKTEKTQIEIYDILEEKSES